MLSSAACDGNGFIVVGGLGNYSIQPPVILQSARLVAFATHTIVSTSRDGLNWTTQQDTIGPSDLPLFPFVNYANDQFFSGGDDLIASLDGITWNARNVGVGNTLADITYGAGKLVAVGSGIVTSTDGEAWTQIDSGTPFALTSIVYGNNQFVAVGNGGTIMTSPDGETWTNRNSGTTNLLASVAYGNGHYVCVERGQIFSSADGINWAPRVSGVGPQADLPRVTFGNGQFVALFLGPMSVSISPDGITWTTHGIADQFNFFNSFALGFGQGLFVAASGPGSIQTSPDGLHWAKRADVNAISGPFSQIKFLDDEFIGCGYLQNPKSQKWMTYSSVDGIVWSERDANAGFLAITFAKGRFFGVGGGMAGLTDLVGKLVANVLPTGSGLRGTVQGVAGQQFAIQTSENLASWNPLTNITISTNGIGQFTNVVSGNVGRRFYRASQIMR